jgi:hypothetical protein
MGRLAHHVCTGAPTQQDEFAEKRSDPAQAALLRVQATGQHALPLSPALLGGRRRP